MFVYRALESFCSEERAHASANADKDSGISNCNNYRASLPPGVAPPPPTPLPDLPPPPAVIRSSSRNSAIRVGHDSPLAAATRTSTL